MPLIDSSVQDIPLEILSSIFLGCIPPPTLGDPGPLVGCTHPAVVLSHVCREWRQLVVGTPPLWSRVHIRTPSLGLLPSGKWLTESDRLRRIIEAWVDRSGRYPLDISFDLRGYGDNFAWENKYSPVMTGGCLDPIRPFLSHAERWKTLCVVMSAQHLAREPFNLFSRALPSNGVPNLESVALKVIGESIRASAMNSFSQEVMRMQLLSGPALRCVRLEGNWNVHDHRSEVLWPHIERWTSLTELDISISRFNHGPGGTHYDASHVLDFLKVFPSLRKAAFNILQREWEDRSVPRTTPITLPILETLSLRGVPPGPALAQSLILPSIKDLSLLFDPYPEHAKPNTPPPGSPAEYYAGALELLQQFGSQLVSLALNHDDSFASRTSAYLELLDRNRLESLLIIREGLFWAEPSEPTMCHGADKGLTRLLRPEMFPNLRHIEVKAGTPSQAIMVGN